MIANLIILALFLIAIFLILRFVKNLFAIISSIILLIIILSSLFAYLLYVDINDFKTNFPDSKNLFILENNNSFVAAIALNFSNMEQTTFLNPNQVNFISSNYPFFKKILENNSNQYYKIFIFSQEYVEQEMPAQISFGNFSLEKQQAIQILNSNSAKKDLFALLLKDVPESTKKAMQEKYQQDTGLTNDNAVKSLLFIQSISKKDQNFFLKMIELHKSNQLKIYPESLFFKTLSYIPKSSLDAISEKVQSNINKN